ncbi:8158_t:CDS:2, partial [Entrophospora sp. SA101]
TTVSTAGFVVKFHVKCKPCKTVSEFINKSETNFNACVAAAGLKLSADTVLQKVIKHHKANKSYKKLTPILEEQDWLLNVTIDGDLDSNKMLELSIRYLQSYKWNGF